MVKEAEGVQVCHVESLNETTEIVIDEKGESAKSVSELLQVTKTTVQGMTKDMPVVGRWRSNDGKVFYLAIGAGFDRNGSVVELGDDE